MINVGSKLRNLRQVLNLTQQEVADKLELTKGYISQIESNKTSPSMKIFDQLLTLYNQTPQDFFGVKEKEELVQITKQFEYVEKQDSNLGFILTDVVKANSSFSCNMVDLQPEGQTEIIPGSPGEEFGYVLMGKIDLIYNFKRYTLEKGDSFYIPSVEDHQFKNTYTRDAKFVWFKTPKRNL